MTEKELKKPRVFILTDIGEYTNEPDDAESLIRLMLYSNEIDIEGIIPTASHCAVDVSDPGYLDRCIRAVEAYRKAYPNLSKHAEGYPDPDYLRSVCKQGTSLCYLDNYDYHLTPEEQKAFDADMMTRMMTRQRKVLANDYEITTPNIGEGCSNDGSELIVKALEKDDPRKIWFCLWGGAGTLAQALYDYRKNHTYQETKAAAQKVCVYDIDGQDDVGGWIIKNFPEVKWLRSDVEFWGFSQALSNPVYDYKYDVGDLTKMDVPWISQHIQAVGPLGEAYPPTKFGIETDTPSLLYCIPNGLNDLDHQSWGGWGGRYTEDRSQNPPAVHFEGDYLLEPMPFYAYRDDVDTYFDPITKKWFINDPLMPVGRWREDYQNDMAARMLWQLADKYEDANHNPVAVLNGDRTKNVLQMTVKPGDRIELDASESFDPDHDALSFKWYLYADPGTYKKPVVIDGADSSKACVHIPEDAVNDELHVILEIEDDGKPFRMKAYRHVVFVTGDGGKTNTAPFTVNDALVNPSALAYFEYIGSWEHKTNQFACNDWDIHTSAVKGNQAILHFTGRKFKLFGAALNNCGKAKITIDGEDAGVVDFYSQFQPWKDNRDIQMWATFGETPLFASRVLDYGEHTVVIEVLGEKNEYSTDCLVNIDKAEIYI